MYCVWQVVNTQTIISNYSVYMCIYIVTYSMVQSPSWEDNWFAASQEIPHISRNPKVHYRTHNRPPTVSILGQPNPVHIPTSHLLEIQHNIIHPSTPRSPRWSLSLRFPQLVKKLSAFHATRNFINALTSVRHLSLSCASPIQSIYPHPNSWRSILILSTHLHLGLPIDFFRSGFPSKALYTSLSSPIRATCPAHLILLIYIYIERERERERESQTSVHELNSFLKVVRKLKLFSP